MAKYNLCLSMTDGKVKAGRFATVALSAEEKALMERHLVSSPITIEADEAEKKPAKKSKKTAEQ